MEIKRNGSQPSSQGSAEWFTGNVRIDPLHQADAPARVGRAYVTTARLPTGWKKLATNSTRLDEVPHKEKKR